MRSFIYTDLLEWFRRDYRYGSDFCKFNPLGSLTRTTGVRWKILRISGHISLELTDGRSEFLTR